MRVIFLGDEVNAAAYRLVGVDARVVSSGEEAPCLAAARSGAELVLVATSVAARMSPLALRSACAAVAPMVAIVPDLGGDGQLPDLATRLRRQLGLVDESPAAMLTASS